MKDLLMLSCVVCVGLMAGLFFSWSVAVMPGLRKLGDREFIASMQAMNKAIQNPVFFLFFFGALLLLIANCFYLYDSPLTGAYYLVLLAMIIYLSGVMGITIAGNVPLNNKLERFDLSAASLEEMRRLRTSFESSWTFWNTIRTIMSFSAFGLLVFRLILISK